MRAISPRQLRELRAVLKSISAGRPVPWRDGQRLLETVDAALVPKRSAALAKKRRASKKAAQRADWEAIRDVVLARANGHCECCGAETGRLECDHFLGGFGRRKTLESVQTVWALDAGCHLQKTRNRPSPTHWLRLFREHCLRHGYHAAAGLAEARLDSLELQGRAVTK